MKNLLKNFSILASVGILSLSALHVSAKNKVIILGADDEEIETMVEDAEPNLEELNFIEMLNSVQLDSKSAEKIRERQEKEGRNLYKNDYNEKNGSMVETYRNKEVILITIPASSLFLPNDTVLRPSATAILNPLKKFVREPDLYRMLLVMHTDNTGSDQYRDQLTEKRADAVFDWFEAQQGVNTEFIYPFAFGDENPLVDNNSMENRAKNRRLEVYLVPGKKMLEQVKRSSK